jgi:hypothetical protein
MKCPWEIDNPASLKAYVAVDDFISGFTTAHAVLMKSRRLVVMNAYAREKKEGLQSIRSDQRYRSGP